MRSNDEFAYRLLLVPMKGPKTDADMALNFVRQDDLTEEEMKGMLGRDGSVIIAEKYREAIHGDEMLPKAAAAEVQKRIGYVFGVYEFTKLRKMWQIGAVRSGSKAQLPKSDGYCVYSPAFGQYVYRQNLVDRMAEAVSTRDSYAEVFGREPVSVVAATPTIADEYNAGS